MNRILAEDFASPDLEFVLLDPQEPDRDDAVTANVAYVGAGILTVDEVRATLGLAPLGKMVKYDPDQPRVPAGQEGGGQWTSGGDGSERAQTQTAWNWLSVFSNDNAGNDDENCPVTPSGESSSEKPSKESSPDAPQQDVKPPLDNFPTPSTKPPGPGYEWKGREGSVPGGKQGKWVNDETGEELRNDMDHLPPEEPHWDYRAPFQNGQRGDEYRWYPDGRVIKK
jgi:hypothetical protein